MDHHYEVFRDWWIYWRNNNIQYDRTKNITLCNYPWILNTASKGLMIKFEAKSVMDDNADQDLLNMFTMSFNAPNAQINPDGLMYLKLDVRRDFIIEDTLNNLIREGVNLKKQLKVNFKGEFGQDEGGVQKEFFQILVRDLFNPEFTMFNYDQESKCVWFNGNTYESNMKFELIGALMGLAIYNGIILDIHFPIACYKKLLDINPTIEDLKEMIPSTGESLQHILDYESPDLEQSLYMTFSYEHEVFGEHRKEELKENGSQIFVNQENKHEYVELLLDFIFNKSIHNQFNAFYRGFHKACGGDMLSLFRPGELQRLIWGCKKLDFEALMRETSYEGYEREDEVINWFWDILLKEFNEEQQKKFLFFSTGWDKAPVSGLESIDFAIVKNGSGDEKLPCAQTCFNIFLLPEYSNKERLKEALLLAIENAEGFGML